MQHIKEILNDLSVENWRNAQVMPTGLVELDELLEGGLRHGRMYLIASRPSLGKTSLALTIAVNLAVNQRVPVGYVTFNTTNEIGERLLNISPSEHQGWQNRLSNAPLWIEHIIHNDLQMKVRSLMQEMVNRNGVNVIFVDALWKDKEDMLAADIISNAAKELHVACVVMCPLSKNVDLRVVHIPMLTDVNPYDVSSLADVVMSIYVPEHYYDSDDEWGSIKDRVDIIVGKNNMGETGIARLYFSKKHKRVCCRFELDMELYENENPF